MVLVSRTKSRPSVTTVEPQATHSLLYYLPLLAPFAAGAGIGALVNKVLIDSDVAGRFWPGIAINPNASVASQATVNAACIVVAAALWIVSARLVKGAASYVDALAREGLAFVPALSILILATIDNSTAIPALWLYATYAVVMSVAGFAAVNALFMAAMRRAPAEASRSGKRALALVLLFAAMYWATFTTMGWLQYDAMNIQYTDTADWQQMLFNTLHGRFLMSSAFPHMFFGEHVEFVHLFLLPLYMIWPSLKMLMAAKSLWLASGAIPVYLLAVRRLKSPAAGACFATVYLLYPAMQWTDLQIDFVTFRPETAAIPALLWAVYCYDANRMWGLAVAAFFAAAAKEEMVLPVAMLGVLLLLRRRWGWGSAFAIGGFAWFFVCVLWVIPHFRHGSSHMVNYYEDFKTLVGSDNVTLGAIFFAMLKHPLHALGVALRPEKIDYLLLLLIPLGLRPLLSWRMLLVALPSFASTLLASRPQSGNIYFHYQIALVPILVSGAIYGAEACAAWIPRLGAVFSAVDDAGRRRGAIAAVSVLVVIASLCGNVLFAKSPISLLFYNHGWETSWVRLYRSTEHTELFFREVRPLVPKDASVSATSCAATYFADREYDYKAPEGIGKVDYVVLDTRDRWYSQDEAAIKAALTEGKYAVSYDKDGFLVYTRAAFGGASRP